MRAGRPFCSPGLAVDVDAAQTWEFAMPLRLMADDADVLAARLDGLPHPWVKTVPAAAGTAKAV